MVYIFLADGFEEIEALTQIDYLRRAGIDIISVGIGGKRIKGAHGIEVTADTTEDEISEDGIEMVILPGGLGGVDGIKSSKRALEVIRSCAENGTFIAAICAAPTILSQMGLLDGKRAVCYPSMSDELGNCIPCGERVAVDGKFITAIAAGASEEFSFVLIEALCGKKAAEKVRAGIYAR